MATQGCILNDTLIENFILNNIKDFSPKYKKPSDTQYIFYNQKLNMYLIPNIEELETVITSNYKSDKICVGYKKNYFQIYSKQIVSKLKQKIKKSITLDLANRKNNTEKLDYEKDKYNETQKYLFCQKYKLR